MNWDIPHQPLIITIAPEVEGTFQLRFFPDDCRLCHPDKTKNKQTQNQKSANSTTLFKAYTTHIKTEQQQKMEAEGCM